MRLPDAQISHKSHKRYYTTFLKGRHQFLVTSGILFFVQDDYLTLHEMGNVYLLKCGNTHFGFRKYNKSYVIGLPSKRMALRIKQAISNTKVINCEKDWCMLGGRGTYISEEESTVSIGELVIQKKTLCYSAVPKIETHDIEEFMLYPTQKNIGIVYGLEMMTESKNEFRFESLIIDPVFDIESYRAAMNS